MAKFPFKAAMSQANELYGLELDEDTFETYAMSAWVKIGNKDFRTKVVKATPEKDPNGGWFVCMPCDLANGGVIEAVTINSEDAQLVTSTDNHAGMYNVATENRIEITKHNPSALYISGKFIKYQELGDKIYFNEPVPSVNILYKAIFTDEDGLPYLNEKEIDAIAAYCAFAEDLKKARLTKDPNTLQMAQLEEQRWKRLCDSARVPMDISQNQMNNILDAAVSRDVHAYGRTYKPQR